MSGRAAIFLLLGLAARAAAQEPVLLRQSATPGQSTRYRTEMDAWIQTALLPSNDTTLPTVHISMLTTRTVLEADSTNTVTIGMVVDTSHFDMPAVRAAAPQFAQSGDILKGMRTETRASFRGRGVVTRVVAAPQIASELPALIRGVQTLALTGIRLSIFTLPDEPAKPGDTWTDSLSYVVAAQQSVTPGIVEGGARGVTSFRFERIEQRGSARVAIISSTLRVSAAGGDPASTASLMVTGTAQFELDVDAGICIRALMDVSGPLATRYGTIPTRMHLVMQSVQP